MPELPLHARQRAFFESGITRPAAFRRAALTTLAEAIDAHEERLLAALREDLGKPAMEAYASEVGFLTAEIRHTLRHLERWMKPARRRTPWLTWPATATVHPEPFGVALVIGPWNYPLQLLLAPAIAAIAAGNCAILKPSELAPRTSAAVAAMINAAFPAEHVAVVEGGRETTEQLLAERSDFIFFTGGTAVGRIVMQAAARHLTPVVLELGGRSPCIVCHDAPPETTARRIVWGKFLNAGQTCVAPDHVWVDRRAAAGLVDHLQREIRSFFGENPQQSPDYGRIINDKQFNRLVGLLDGIAVTHGGRHEAAGRFIEPTLVLDPPADSALLAEEIFGPILPVLTFDSLDEVVGVQRGQPVPLALYLFTGDRAVERRVLAEIRSGGVCVNDTVSHILARDLPFGGLGESGMGAYHGKTGFDAFSHHRSVMRRPFSPDPSFRYPPPQAGLGTLKRMLRWFG